jgi:RNA polymerase sigma-70 factor (ECF subfamily)
LKASFRSSARSCSQSRTVAWSVARGCREPAPDSRSDLRSHFEDDAVKDLSLSGHEGPVLGLRVDGRGRGDLEAEASARPSRDLVETTRARTPADVLFRSHARFVASFVFRLGVSAEAVDDVVQEVFLTAHRRGGYEDGPAQPTTWLAEIALRVVSTHKRGLRRKRTESNEEALSAAVSRAAGPDDTAEQRETLRRVEAALGAIPIERRAVFILFEIEGESTDAIAEGLGIPAGTVHSRLHKARREFQEAYEGLTDSSLEGRHGR